MSNASAKILKWVLEQKGDKWITILIVPLVDRFEYGENTQWAEILVAESKFIKAL